MVKTASQLKAGDVIVFCNTRIPLTRVEVYDAPRGGSQAPYVMVLIDDRDAPVARGWHHVDFHNQYHVEGKAVSA